MPPMAGAGAGVIVPVPSDGPVGEPERIVTVAPTDEPVPVTRKSPAFQRAVPIVIRSVTGATVSAADRSDSAP